MVKIYIVEDNKNLCNELSLFLERYNYNVSNVNSFENIENEFKEIKPDIVLLDINLPYFDGFYLCKQLKNISDTPIIFITSRDNTSDEILAMTIGGDDYITKPFDNQVLLARISAVLKRYNKTTTNQIIKLEDIEVNTTSYTMYKIGQSDNTIELTKNELKLLLTLINSKGSVVSRDKLMETLWDDGVFVDENTLSVNISRVRSKISQLGYSDIIKTIRGRGYIIK